MRRYNEQFSRFYPSFFFVYISLKENFYNIIELDKVILEVSMQFM